jgi:hypothetical protein
VTRIEPIPHTTPEALASRDQHHPGHFLESLAKYDIVNCSAFLVNKLDERLETFIEEHNWAMKWTKPKAGTTAFIKFVDKEGRAIDDVVFCQRLQEMTGVMLAQLCSSMNVSRTSRFWRDRRRLRCNKFSTHGLDSRQNLEVLETFIEEHNWAMKWTKPKAGTTAFIKFRQCMSGHAIVDLTNRDESIITGRGTSLDNLRIRRLDCFAES